MKTHLQPDLPRGVALIIVMLVIIGLTALAGGFAYSMKLEVRLARNANMDADFEWLGRSGIEFARYVLGQQMNVQTEPYDSLNQKWAGGPGGFFTNELMGGITLEDNPLGPGSFSVKIVDLERKFNINIIDDVMMRQALIVMGADADITPTIVDSIQDWIDRDDNPHLSGAESDFYLTLTPAYYAKNGPLDDISELLLINGVTPAMYWGPRASNHANQGLLSRRFGPLGLDQEPAYRVGFVDLFTTLSARFININTASAEVMQLIPGMDENVALAVITTRAGPDGVDGTEDDIPFRNPGELINVPGMTQGLASALMQRQLVAVRSATFEVTVTAQLGRHRKDFVAILRRNNQNDIQILSFHWN